MALYDGRDADDLLSSGLNVIDAALNATCLQIPVTSRRLVPLFSGGHDSYCACYVASQHNRFDGLVYHIDTGIGSVRTRQFVEEVCSDEGWTLRVLKSRRSYEAIVRKMGFPGPAMHYQCYQQLKYGAIQQALRGKARPTLLITGARKQESTRRMGNTEPYSQGSRRGNSDRHWVWTSPCYDWSGLEQRHFMDVNGLALNPVKTGPLGMSGECFCGCFARPYELELVKEHVPDVALEIDRLTTIARQCGKVDSWGWGNRRKAPGGKVVIEEVLPTGPMCNSCDARAAAACVVVKDVG